MKYIITEEQNEHLKRWNIFHKFMIRRHPMIIELIDDNVEDIDRYDYEISPETVIMWVVDEFIEEIEKSNDYEEFEFSDWVDPYIRDNYGELIINKVEEYKSR